MTPYPYSVMISSSPGPRTRGVLFPGIWRNALFATLAVGAAMRLVTIGQAPIWLDEAYTLWFMEQSWEFLWQTMAGTETFPPLYYSAMKLWAGVFGTSEVALRLPTALAGVVCILLVAIAGRLAGGRTAGPAFGVMAGAICALWQFQIHYAMEARPYSLATLSVALMLAGSAQVMRHPDALRRPWGDFVAQERTTLLGMIAIGFGLALAPWMHVMGAIPTLITGIYLLGWWAMAERCDRAVLFKLLAVAGLAILLYLPNLRFVMTLGDRDMEDFWLQAPKIWQLLLITVQVYAQKVMNLPLKAEALIMVALSVAGTIGFWRLSRASGRGGSAIFGLVLALMAGHWIVMVLLTYTVQPVLLPRTLIFSQPPLFLLLAGLPWCLPARARAAAGFGFLAYLGAGFALHDIRLNAYADYRQMVATIASSPEADAPIMVMPGHFILPFTYYTNRQDRPLDVRAFPSYAPDFGKSPAIISTQDPSTDQIADLLASLAGERHVWVMMGNNQKNHQEVFDAFENAGFERGIAVGAADYFPNLNYFTKSGDQTLAFGP